jgi:hypothetical protein
MERVAGLALVKDVGTGGKAASPAAREHFSTFGDVKACE